MIQQESQAKVADNSGALVKSLTIKVLVVQDVNLLTSATHIVAPANVTLRGVVKAR